MLYGDWREHGRYKWYAEQLEAGETVTIEDEAEMKKAKRAWTLYIRPEARVGRECVVELRRGKFLLQVRSEE